MQDYKKRVARFQEEYPTLYQKIGKQGQAQLARAYKREQVQEWTAIVLAGLIFVIAMVI